MELEVVLLVAAALCVPVGYAVYLLIDHVVCCTEGDVFVVAQD